MLVRRIFSGAFRIFKTIVCIASTLWIAIGAILLTKLILNAILGIQQGA